MVCQPAYPSSSSEKHSDELLAAIDVHAVHSMDGITARPRCSASDEAELPPRRAGSPKTFSPPARPRTLAEVHLGQLYGNTLNVRCNDSPGLAHNTRVRFPASDPDREHGTRRGRAKGQKSEKKNKQLNFARELCPTSLGDLLDKWGFPDCLPSMDRAGRCVSRLVA